MSLEAVPTKGDYEDCEACGGCGTVSGYCPCCDGGCDATPQETCEECDGHGSVYVGPSDDLEAYVTIEE